MFSDFSSVYMNNRIRLHKKSKMITKNLVEKNEPSRNFITVSGFENLGAALLFPAMTRFAK